MQLPIGEGQEGERWSQNMQLNVSLKQSLDTCPVNYIFPSPFHLNKQESLK